MEKAGFTYYPAPGKINLFLKVIGKLPNGYHSIQTVFQFINLEDLIGIRRTNATQVKRVSKHAWPESHDLVVKAAKLLRDSFGVTEGIEIDVVKRIPDGAGFGGGSSDAATVLLVLNKRWELNLSRDRLIQLASVLGADVPVFIGGKAAFAEGIGDQLTPVQPDECWYLLIYPRCRVSTKDIFCDPELTRNSKPIKMSAFSSFSGQNDLQKTVCRLHEEVGAALDWANRHGAAAMSGSGSGVFCPFPDVFSARAVLAELPHKWLGFVAKGFNRHPLMSC